MDLRRFTAVVEALLIMAVVVRVVQVVPAAPARTVLALGAIDRDQARRPLPAAAAVPLAIEQLMTGATMRVIIQTCISLVSGAALILLITMAYAYGGERSALTVVVAPLQKSSIENRIVATGTVAAWRNMSVGSEAGGLAVTEILVDEGDVVRRGEVLARLNQSVLKAQVVQQEAAIVELEATLHNAKADVERTREVSRGVISAQTILQRETLVKTTTAKLQAARALLDEGRAKLRQTDITAPANGLIASRNITLGQVVQTGTELFRIIRDGRIEVDTKVPESSLSRILPDQAAVVTGPDGQKVEAKVRRVAPMVDAGSRLGTVHIVLPAKTSLKPGMFANVVIKANAVMALAVPLKSLIWRNATANVFTVGHDGTARLKKISTGRITSNAVEVTAGLQLGDRIVVEGAGLLSDGDRVRVVMASANDMEASLP